MTSYEYLVIDISTDRVLGVFDDLNNTLIFIKGYYDEYFKEPNLQVIIVRRERE